MVAQLKALGHAEVKVGPPMFKANAIEVKDGRLLGAADPRSEGKAVGE
jgi:gamma-glutamyltranspeptidase/glutathione hydrolase